MESPKMEYGDLVHPLHGMIASTICFLFGAIIMDSLLQIKRLKNQEKEIKSHRE